MQKHQTVIWSNRQWISCLNQTIFIKPRDALCYLHTCSSHTRGGDDYCTHTHTHTHTHTQSHTLVLLQLLWWRLHHARLQALTLTSWNNTAVCQCSCDTHTHTLCESVCVLDNFRLAVITVTCLLFCFRKNSGTKTIQVYCCILLCNIWTLSANIISPQMYRCWLISNSKMCLRPVRNSVSSTQFVQQRAPTRLFSHCQMSQTDLSHCSVRNELNDPQTCLCFLCVKVKVWGHFASCSDSNQNEPVNVSPIKCCSNVMSLLPLSRKNY